MRLLVSKVGLGSALALVAFLGGCSGTLGVGAPPPEETNANAPPPGAPPAPASPGLPQPEPGALKYEWQWVNPQATGVALRAAFALPSGEIWYVGDAGTVLRDVAGTVSVMRVGIEEETLSAVWGRGPDDVWVAGARGAGGTLMHWNGKAWSDSFPVATHPIDAMAGLSNGDVAFVMNGRPYLMHPEGSATNFCPFHPPYTGIGAVRDIWVQSDDAIWIGGEGIARYTPKGSCTRVDDRKTLALWGDKASRIVALSTSGSRIELRDWTADGFVPIGAPFADSQRDVRGGKLLAADAAGRLHVILHAVSAEGEGHATYDPVTGLITETDIQREDLPGPLTREILYGLVANAGQVTFAGSRGLRGHFASATPVPSNFRRTLRKGLPSPDGTAFALCSNFWEYEDTTVCRWDSVGGWTPLPTVEAYYATEGVATSATTVLLGGWSTPNRHHRTRTWNGSTWTEGPQQTRFSPLFASGPNDVWAASDQDTVHFDGTAWSTVAQGRPYRVVDGLAPNDVWFLHPESGLAHWDGSKLSAISLPPDYRGTVARRGLVAVKDGVWLAGVRTGGWPSPERLLHFNGKDWVNLELPGLTIESLARGPDGKVRMLSKGPGSAVYIVEDTGTTKELDLPEGVYLTDIFAAGSDFFAVGQSGATLRLTKVAADTH